MKFKVGDVVTGTREDQYPYNREIKIKSIGKSLTGEQGYILEDIPNMPYDLAWFDKELKLVKQEKVLNWRKKLKQ